MGNDREFTMETWAESVSANQLHGVITPVSSESSHSSSSLESDHQQIRKKNQMHLGGIGKVISENLYQKLGLNLFEPIDNRMKEPQYHQHHLVHLR